MANLATIRSQYPVIILIRAWLIACALLAICAGPLAAEEPARWHRVNIPTDGAGGQWVLADGSDVRQLTVAGDGTLYACGQGLTYTLYRSTDGGRGWSHVGSVEAAIVAIAVSAEDPSILYYATASAVYRSANGGKTFSALPDIPGGTGGNNVEITSLDVTWLDDNIIAAATRDTDSGEYGGVYTLDEATPAATWTDTGLGGYDAYAVAFSPGYAEDRQLAAVVTDETDTLVTSRIAAGGWGATLGDAVLNKDNASGPNPVAVAASAVMAFPDNYDAFGSAGYSEMFVGIDTGSGQGDVYKISGADAPSASAATDLNVGARENQANTDITGLAAAGDSPDAYLLAGAADTATVYRSDDGGDDWKLSRRQPSGAALTEVLAMPDGAETGSFFAATSGDESALSVSRDGGENWQQLSLIDTGMTTLLDMMPSPDYSRDNTLFLVSYGGKHSLWHSADGGASWTRLLNSAADDIDSISRVALPPDYSAENQTVFAAGESGGYPAFWKSGDNGRSFRRRPTRDPDTGATIAIDAWAIIDDESLFIGGFDGSRGLVYHVTKSGFDYAPGAPAGSQSLHSMAISPAYGQDGTVLAGSTGGYVYWSDDNGASFESLPSDAASPPLSGAISVAFDPDFAENGIVYAASGVAGGGIHRFVVGSSADWTSLDSNLPGGATLRRLVTGASGVLYAANSEAGGGLERCLYPRHSLDPTFETETGGLAAGAILSGLWHSGQRLWAIDTANTRLMSLNDTLTEPVVLTSPDDKAAGTGNLINHSINNVSLDWETLQGATSYRWQLDSDTDLSNVPSGFEATTQASSVIAPVLQPATTYYWRVRASAPLYSPWSARQSFTTGLDTEAVTLRLESPAAGAGGVPVKPIFQWSAAAGADSYELLVAASSNFTSPAITKTGEYALPASAWECDVALDYATTYYWKVRAVNAATASAWSSSGAFTTKPVADEPLPVMEELPDAPPVAAPAVIPANPTPQLLTPPLPSPPPSPSPAPQAPAAPLQQPLQVPTWAIYLIGGLLLVILLALLIILTLVFSFRRL